jgi:hypothetical protein
LVQSSGELASDDLRETCRLITQRNWDAIGTLRHQLLQVDIPRLPSSVPEVTILALFLAKELIDRIWANFGTDASFQLPEGGGPLLVETAVEAATVLMQGLDGTVDAEHIAHAVGTYFGAARERDRLIQQARGARSEEGEDVITG